MELIAAADVDAAAGFYDGRAPSVREYLVQLCRPELVDEATLAAFVDFRGRAANVPPDADADSILSRAARAAVAGRLDLRDARSAECRATAELLVARMNGELIRSEDPLEQHLKGCSTCRQTAVRLTNADAALTGAGGEAPPDHLRASWLELVGQETVTKADDAAVGRGAATASDNGTTPDRAASAEHERPVDQEQVAPESEPEPSRQVRVRGRRGGLVGAARRLASSPRRHQ